MYVEKNFGEIFRYHVWGRARGGGRGIPPSRLLPFGKASTEQGGSEAVFLYPLLFEFNLDDCLRLGEEERGSHGGS